MSEPSGTATVAQAYLICGTDAGLVSQALSSLLGELAGPSGDATPVEEYGVLSRDDPFPLGAVLDACRTPPFLTEQRIVVARDVAMLDAAQRAELIDYLREPLPSTVLILTYPLTATPRTSVPAPLARAVRAVGIVIDTVPPTASRARGEWFGERLRDAPVTLDGPAAALLREHLGEDLARLEGILASLEASFGGGARIDADSLEPFLGAEGSVAPWDLTDALDAGNASDAVHVLHRMLAAGGRHPLQILSTLHRHFGAMLRLDGAVGLDEQGAIAATGLAPFPARKVLEQSRRLGHESIARAIELLAAADLDLRGRAGWPDVLVLEVLVARLAQLARRRPAGVSRRRT